MGNNNYNIKKIDKIIIRLDDASIKINLRLNKEVQENEKVYVLEKT